MPCSAVGVFSTSGLTRRAGAVGAANRSARSYRASSRARFGRSTGGELRPSFDVASQQRHSPTSRAQARRPRFEAPTVVGIDDWAWRRNQRYGTIICDLERRKNDRVAPGSRTSDGSSLALRPATDRRRRARDRGGGYALAAKKALPQATQVADRWHLMENASHAFLDAVRKSMRQIRVAIGAAKIDPDLLTAAETIQYEGYLRREETNAVILGLAKDGVTIKEIVRRTGYSRGLARKVLRGQRSDVFRVRESSLEVHLPWLDAQWAVGRRNGAELWRQLKQQGFRGCLRVVAEWAARRRQADKVDIGAISRAPSARTIARVMTIGRDGLSKSETVVVAAIERGVPMLVQAREIIAAFQAMVRRKSLVDLDPWLEQARTSLVAPFVKGVIKDKAAVDAAISSNWSNGPNRGSNHQAQARQAPNVRARKARFAPSPPDWRSVRPRHQNCVRANFGRRNTYYRRSGFR